jgi:F-type H+-transporting ATPase subunit delta
MSQNFSTQAAQMLFASLQEAKAKGDDEQKVIDAFMTVLKRTGTLSRGTAIIAELTQMLEQSENILRPVVTSADPLTQEQVQALTAQLQKKYEGSIIEIDQRIDPTVLGGVSIRVGDMLYDDTLKNKLLTLKNTLTQ